MSEERHTIKLPDDARVRYSNWTIEGLTDEQVQALHDQLEAILNQPQKRQWRDWDVVELQGLTLGNVAIRMRTSSAFPWRSIGDKDEWYPDSEIQKLSPRYRGNLRDLLTEGDSLLAFNKKELERIRAIIAPIADTENNKACAKVDVALARHRESQ